MPVQAVSNITTPTFRGQMAVTEKGNKYYKTDNGLKVGAIYGGIGVVTSFFDGTIIGGLIGLGMHSAIGAFLDHKRNKNAAEAADYVKQVGVNQAIKTRDDIYLSRRNGQPYYVSNVGTKYGTAIGAGIGAVIGMLPASIMTALGLGKLKSKEMAAGGILLFGAFTAISALGGFILGKITDYHTNKNAELNA